LRFLCLFVNCCVYLIETKTTNVLEPYFSTLYVYFSIQTPLQSKNLCQSTFQQFPNSIEVELCLMEGPQLNCWFDFIVGRVVMTSKKFLQFWKETKIRQASRGLMQKHSMLHARTHSSKPCFLLPYCFTLRKVLMVLPVGMNSEYSTSLKSQTIVDMILTANTAVLNILVLVILCDLTPLTTSRSE
jgi:hypothetical protein